MLCHSGDGFEPPCLGPEPTPLTHRTGEIVFHPHPPGLKLQLWISDPLTSAALDETGAAKAGYKHLSLIVPPKFIVQKRPASFGKPQDPCDSIASLPWSDGEKQYNLWIHNVICKHHIEGKCRRTPCKWEHPPLPDITRALTQLMDSVRDVTSGAMELLRPVAIQPWDAELPRLRCPADLK
ncbi:unnamed protein product [Cladocopium goreaui]|uniref:C3H1-type domain-containing protein n=1 Tax=Cladocopium goreaui TaxID=2562237 RepID=A0A9P1GGY3_9DINO|nr:unnamed protein product [Cladocopium goreaui]